MMPNFGEQPNFYIQFCLEDFKVNFPCKEIVEVYTKIFYTSYWIDFLATYSKVKVFSDRDLVQF